MAEYRFHTEWRFQAPVAQVFAVILDSYRWPQWWKGLERVENIHVGNAEGVGSVRRYTWKSASPYRLRFNARTTRIVPHIEITAIVEGDLAGTGRWLFSESDDAAIVHYLWQVKTEKFWMNLVAPVARPIFRRNHHLLMERGAQGLAHHLQAPLLDIQHLDDAVSPA